MSDEPDSLALRDPGRIDEKVDRLGDKMAEVVRRVGAPGLGVAGLGAATAELGVGVDGFKARLQRIERSLDLVDERAAS